jgi:hypothetical protein
MKKPAFTSKHAFLLFGDLILISVVTLLGFASHNTLTTAGAHMLTTFLPLAAAWLMVAVPFGLYDLRIAGRSSYLWRPFWAMILAGPMMGFLRGLMLGSNIVPVFVIVVGGIGALGMLLWRGLFALWIARHELQHG